MSEDYLAQQQPTLIWNSARGVWEKAGTANLLCAHSELFSGTWPTSGMMLAGKVYELQTQERHTTGSEFSSLPEETMIRTPSVTDSTGGARSAKQASERGQMVKTADQMAQLAFENGLKVSPAVANSLLPTPKARDAQAEGYEAGLRRASPQVGTIAKAIVDGDDRINLMPTPTTRDHKDGTEPHERNGVIQTDTVVRAVFNSGEVLLPTPNTMEHREIKTPEQIAELKKRSPGGYRNLREEVVHEAINWGKFEPAIRRWETILGRPAPAPTKPDGKDGAHRLSSEFTEWMMGVPEGWITGCGLSRNDELKACGNGVVPQQAELAIRMLIGGKENG